MSLVSKKKGKKGTTAYGGDVRGRIVYCTSSTLLIPVGSLSDRLFLPSGSINQFQLSPMALKLNMVQLFPNSLKLEVVRVSQQTKTELDTESDNI